MKATVGLTSLVWLASAGGSTAFVALPSSRAITANSGSFGGKAVASSCRSAVARARPARATYASGPGLSMLVEPKGKDSFKEIEAEVESDPLKKSLGNMTPGVAKAVLTGVIPIASAVGFLAMPTSRIAFSAIGALASGIGGGLARKKLVQARREAAPAQVAKLLDSKGVGNITPAELIEVLATFGLEGEEAEDVLIQIFAKYVVAMCQNSATKTSEIKELSELRETLGLDGLTMGEALYQAASPIYSKFVARTPSTELADEWSPNRRALDKFIFLCDRMFMVCDTEEAYLFEMSRISKTFDVTLPEVKDRCAAIAGPFYQKALGSAVTRWESVKPEQLERARRTLGMEEDVAEVMHKDVYKKEALACVKKEREGGVMKLDPEDRQKIDKLAEAFDLSDEQAVKEYESILIPIYEELVVECLTKIMREESKADLARTYGELMMFTMDTQLRQEEANAVLRDIMMATMQDMYDDATQFVRVANSKGAALAARTMAAFVQSALEMVSINLSGQTTSYEESYNIVLGGPIVKTKNRGDAPGLYEMFLKSYFSQSEMSASDQESIALLAKLLAINPEQQVKVYRDAAGPRVLQQLKESVKVGLESGDFSDEAKAANDELVENFKIPFIVIAEQAKGLYEETLGAWAENNRIITENEKKTLDKMAAFLSMDSTAVEEIHSKLCSGTLRKAVAETMGATGIVAPEYRVKLEELSDRLGLTKEAAKLMFHAAIRQRMEPLIKQIMYEFERSVLSKDQLAQKTGKDVGADVLVGSSGGTLGIEESSAVTSDVLSLIDFYVDNSIIEEGDDGEDVYPVTAKQLGTKTQMLEALYQNFVVSGFSVEGEQLKRYEQGQKKLAGILGLEPEVKSKIHREIGGTVVGRFLGQELAKSGKLSSQGVAFLANIQSRLGMPQEEFNDMVTQTKKNYLVRKGENLFRISSLKASDCKRLRDLAEQLGMSLEREGALELLSRKSIFEIEAEEMIEGGDLEGDSGKDFIEDLQESLSLSTEEAQETLSSMLKDRCKGILEGIKANAREGRDASILVATERLLKYCRLAGGMSVENTLDERQRNVVINSYVAKHDDMTEEGSEGEVEANAKVAEDLELLKLAIGMEEDTA